MFGIFFKFKLYLRNFFLICLKGQSCIAFKIDKEALVVKFDYDSALFVANKKQFYRIPV